MQHLGPTLRRLREANGYTLQEVADWFGINRTSVWAWENKPNVRPETDRLRRLAARYGTSVDSLLDGTAQAALGSGLPEQPLNEGVASPTSGYSGNPIQVVRVKALIRLFADGKVEELPSTPSVRVVHTDKLSKVDSYIGYLVTSSANPAFRHGTAILVSATLPFRIDRLAMLNLASGESMLVAPLVDHGDAIKVETMEGGTLTFLRSDIASIHPVINIDPDPVVKEIEQA